jgi:hypothetical protein
VAESARRLHHSGMIPTAATAPRAIAI